MCGIFGTIGKEIGRDEFLKGLHTMDHRGPDDYGSQEIHSPSLGKIWFGQTRLSIVDLSPQGHQPMGNKKGDWIVFNGEVYNHNEIREELRSLGESFTSKTDTEVILKAWLRWGESCISKFNGMFAFAIYVKEQDSIHIVRDRLGIKPLYYWLESNQLCFFSELKPILSLDTFSKVIDPVSFLQYMQWQYVPAPKTIFMDVFKLEPGHLLKWDKKGISVKRYWNAANPFLENRKNISENEILDQIQNLLRDSVRYRMVADVPVGCFLSGGIDSTLISSVMNELSDTQIHTFSIGVNEKGLDEAGYAREIAKHLGTIHHEHYIEVEKVKEMIPIMNRFYDEPYADASMLPTTLVCEHARKNVTVCLSGDGGDELFCGYYRYEWMKQLSTLANTPLRKMSSFLLREVPFHKFLPIETARRLKKAGAVLDWENLADQYRCMANVWYKQEFNSLFGEIVNDNPASKLIQPGRNLIENLMFVDIHMYMVDDILTKVDRASMSVSLEARVPFLDYRIVEFAQKIPLELKFKNKEKKYLLKKVLERYVPRNLWERPKAGFEIPIRKWMMNDLFDWMSDLLSPASLSSHDLINAKRVEEMIRIHKSGEVDYGFQLWTLVMFQSWYEMYMK